jgi:hypothetical protein
MKTTKYLTVPVSASHPGRLRLSLGRAIFVLVLSVALIGILLAHYFLTGHAGTSLDDEVISSSPTLKRVSVQAPVPTPDCNKLLARALAIRSRPTTAMAPATRQIQTPSEWLVRPPSPLPARFAHVESAIARINSLFPESSEHYLPARFPIPPLVFFPALASNECLLMSQYCNNIPLDPDAHIRDLLLSFLLDCSLSWSPWYNQCVSIDVGSNIGLHTLTMLRLGSQV